MKFMCGQPELTSTGKRHLQMYGELNRRLRRDPGVNKAFGQPVTKKGAQGAIDYINGPRNGSVEQAIAYCTSTWYCGSCSVGDHAEANGFFKFSYEADVEAVTTTHGSAEPVCHKDHAGFKYKNKQGPVFWYGQPKGQHGGKRDGSGSKEILAKMRDAIKAGARHADLAMELPNHHARYHSWCSKLIVVFGIQPRKAEYTREECCEMINMSPIPFGDKCPE